MLDVGVISTSAFHKWPFSMRGGVVRERRIEHQRGQMAEFVLGLEPRSRVAVERTGQNPRFVVPLSGGVDNREAPVANIHLWGPQQSARARSSPASVPAGIGR